jgi:plasmid stabilization system protein ParE
VDGHLRAERTAPSFSRRAALGGPFGEGSEELSQREVEGVREFIQVHQTDVPFAAFNAADVVPVQVGAFGQRLLRELSRLSEFPHAGAEGRPHIASHPRRIRRLVRSGLHTMSVIYTHARMHPGAQTSACRPI